MSDDRERMVSLLRETLFAHSWVRAAWLGGSDATGRTDRFSDIDIVAVVNDEEVENAFVTVRNALLRIAPIELEWRVPSPSWHGHEQVFYRLCDIDQHLIIDFVAMKQSTPPAMRLLERERHGNPIILFDHDGFIAAVPMDEAAHASKLRTRFERIRVTFPMFQPLVIRAVEREQATDAAYWYMQLTLVPLVELLRMRYCPERFDFGMRYLADDLPGNIYREVCELALPGSLEGVRLCRARAEAVFRRELAAMESAKDQA